MNLPPEKKNTKTNSSSQPPSFSSLPDEISVNCLARIPVSYYSSLSVVCKCFKSLLSSTELYADRSHLGKTEQCLYVCFKDYDHQFPQWLRLWINPNQTLPNSSVTWKIKTKKTTVGRLLVPIPPCNFPAQSESTVAVVGFEIYVIGGLAVRVRVLDCRSHTWRDAPSMNVAHAHASSCVHDGKIYVMGGCQRLDDDESWAEVFDTKTRTWECLPNPGTEVHMCHNPEIIGKMEGKIYFRTADKMNAYGIKHGKWECFENESAKFPQSECVIENVSYRYGSDRQSLCQWYDINDENWKDVKGLDLLGNKYRWSRGSSGSIRKLVSYGGKLLLIWEVYKMRNPNGMRKIWCGEIIVEKSDGGEVWGNVGWVDAVHRAPTSCELMHCLVVFV